VDAQAFVIVTITLPLQDLLANSKELSSGVQDLLKLRNTVKVTTAYALRRDDPMIVATFVAQNCELKCC
jgi:hypothetical protein